MKKLLVLLLSICLVCAVFTGCGEKEEKFKVGFIFIHDENSTYDLNFLKGAEAAVKKLGLTEDQVIYAKVVPETNACYDEASNMVDQGCKVIFADSFGHEPFMVKAAKENPDVQFCHATGTQAATCGLDNYHNAFASIYEGRFLAGVTAGLKLNEMIEAGTITAEQAVMGYVGAFPYAEVISGYTSFYLGAKYVCPSVTMKVNFTNSWYSVDDERDVANALMDAGCVLISQHADSLGAPSACEQRGVPNVAYNGSTIDTCPKTFLVASRINWEPYFEYMLNAAMKGETIEQNYTGTVAGGAVELSELNEAAVAEGTAAKIEEVKADLASGKLHVFDTSFFTVGGETLTSYKADVEDMGDYQPETEVIADGYFHESEYRSAPYFDINIDGITRLDK